MALQGLADEFGMIITVKHYPPGASKWNPIDHQMFILISANWAGEPLVSYETILGYIGPIRRGRRSSISLAIHDISGIPGSPMDRVGEFGSWWAPGGDPNVSSAIFGRIIRV